MGNIDKTVPSHSQQAIPIPIPVKLELLFPIPWDSHGTHGNSQHSLTSSVNGALGLLRSVYSETLQGGKIFIMFIVKINRDQRVVSLFVIMIL